MSDALDPALAFELAQSLKSIKGAEYMPEAAVRAIATDLRELCTGAVIGRQVWPADQQALWLVSEARNTWDAWGGSAALRKMFRAKFDPEPPPSNAFKPLEGPKPELFGEWWTAADAAKAKAACERRDKMWRELRRELQVHGGAWPSSDKIAAAAEKLGYREHARLWRAD